MPRRKGKLQLPYGGLDLSNVPDQEPILKNQSAKFYEDNTRNRPVGPSASKYMGIYKEKNTELWRAQIMIDGRVTNLGSYSREEDAARVYAKAAFAVKKTKPSDGIYGGLDLRNVPDQPLITRMVDKNDKKTGAVKYKGVKRCRLKWQARISFQGRRIDLGTFDTQEQAAAVYSKAAYFVAQQQQQQQQQQKQQQQQQQPQPLQQQPDQLPSKSRTRKKAGDEVALELEAGKAPPADHQQHSGLPPRKRPRQFEGIYVEI